MRQVGVVAAAGIVALESMIERMEDDHANARRLAEGLREIPAIEIEAEPQTNMIYLRLASGTEVSEAALVHRLGERGILISGPDAGRFRLVTHCWITAADVELAARAFREVLLN
jgi:threonine aldolase